MKKFCIGALLALSVLCLTQQSAEAWINSKFGVGLNWAWQSGGNNFLWGAVRGGQPPGPEYGAPHGFHHHDAVPSFYAPHAMQMAPVAPAAPVATTPAPAPSNAAYYYQPTYQSVSYPGYYYPNSYYYYGR